MTVPSYTEDLTDVDLAEAETNWSESSDSAWDDGGSETADTDYPYIQGTVAITQQATKASIASLLVNYGSGITLPTDGAYLVWQFFASSTGLDTYANGGMRVMVGNTDGDFYSWDVGGVDRGRNPYGGWMNHAVNTTVSSDDTVGAPTTTEQYIGAAVKTLVAIGKGNPHGVDAIRYGRCSSIFEFGETDDYCTFAGYATENDYNDVTNGYHRWGLIQEIAGGYLYKGKMTLGTDTNAVDFRDSNVSVLIDDTPKVTPNFNTIEVNNASSRIDWDNIKLTALSTTSPGRLICNANATLNWDNCQFTGMSTFAFGGSNSSCVSNIWNTCGLVTASGGSFDSCSFASSTATAAVATDTLNVLTDCVFTSSGTGHAVDLGTITSSGTMAWDNYDYDYAATDGSTGNETLKITIASPYALTVNVGAGYTTPTVYKIGTGTVSVVSGQVTLTITVKDIDTGTIIQGARVLVKAAAGGSLSEGTVIIDKVLTDVNGEVSDTRSYSTNQPITGWVRKATGTPYYKEGPVAGTIDNAAGLSLTVQLIPDV